MFLLLNVKLAAHMRRIVIDKNITLCGLWLQNGAEDTSSRSYYNHTTSHYIQ